MRRVARQTLWMCAGADVACAARRVPSSSTFIVTHARARRDDAVETMPIRLQKKATRVARAVVEEVNAARGVGSRTDKHGNVKTSLWDHGKVRARAWIRGRWMGACAWMWGQAR